MFHSFYVLNIHVYLLVNMDSLGVSSLVFPMHNSNEFVAFQFRFHIKLVSQWRRFYGEIAPEKKKHVEFIDHLQKVPHDLEICLVFVVNKLCSFFQFIVEKIVLNISDLFFSLSLCVSFKSYCEYRISKENHTK